MQRDLHASVVRPPAARFALVCTQLMCWTLPARLLISMRAGCSTAPSSGRTSLQTAALVMTCDDRGPKHASPVPESAAGSADAWLAWHAASLEGTGSRRTGAPAEKALLSGRRHCHKSASWMYWNIVRTSSVTWSQAAILSKTRYDTLFCCRALPCAYLRLCQLQPSRVLAQWHACTPSFG